MKTTLELPDDLVREMKLRAVNEGRKFKDLAAELLRLGLTAHETPAGRPAFEENDAIGIDAKTGFPYIKCRPGAPAEKMTIDEILALERSTQEQEDIERFERAFRQ